MGSATSDLGNQFANSKEQGKHVEELNGNSRARKAGGHAQLLTVIFRASLGLRKHVDICSIATHKQEKHSKSISGAREACGRAQCPPLLPVGVSVPNDRDSLESTLADIRSHIEAVPQTLDAAYFALLFSEACRNAFLYCL